MSTPSVFFSKKMGGFGPIRYLSPFNRLIRERDWFTSIDLKDVQFHILISPPRRKFLRFLFRGIAYKYQKMPFGYSWAPRTFTECSESVQRPLCRLGVRILSYLGDILSWLEEAAMSQTRWVVARLLSLGFAVNWRGA